MVEHKERLNGRTLRTFCSVFFFRDEETVAVIDTCRDSMANKGGLRNIYLCAINTWTNTNEYVLICKGGKKEILKYIFNKCVLAYSSKIGLETECYCLILFFLIF